MRRGPRVGPAWMPDLNRLQKLSTSGFGAFRRADSVRLGSTAAGSSHPDEERFRRRSYSIRGRILLTISSTILRLKGLRRNPSYMPLASGTIADSGRELISITGISLNSGLFL